MIHTVYIVRCTQCHAPLRDQYMPNHLPKYFYSVDNIPEVMKQQGWKTVNHTQLCSTCSSRTPSTEL